MNQIVMFGTGKLAAFYMNLLHKLGWSPLFFVDNDEKKWGKECLGYEIKTPEVLRNAEYKIVISCDYVSEIKEQLLNMGIDEKNVLTYQHLLRKYLEQNRIGEQHSAPLVKKEKERIIIDTFQGTGWGGTEIWSYRVGAGLKERGHHVIIYGLEDQPRQEEWEGLIRRFPVHDETYWDVIWDIVEDMREQLPFILINNWSSHVLGAAYYLQYCYPGQVRIISMVHNDSDMWYGMVVPWADIFEKISCVSQKIKNTLETEYHISSQKLFYKANFIESHAGDFQNQRETQDPIHIGWGARMEIRQKRADLLIPLIKQMEQTGVNYRLEIAGSGTYEEILRQWVEEHGLNQRVKLYGYIDPKDMDTFWRRQHIYVNLSEYEGASLAMLEAMSYGAVPVVTEVSGVREFIEHGRNGYYTPIGDIRAIVQYINELSHDEEKRKEYSLNCQRIIMEKCNYDAYISYMEALVGQE